VSADEVLGRERELAALDRFLEEPGGTTVLLLEGDAGIGKTTLWLAGLGHARRRGLRVLKCRPAEAEAQLSFAGLTDLFEGVLGDVRAGLDRHGGGRWRPRALTFAARRLGGSNISFLCTARLGDCPSRLDDLGRQFEPGAVTRLRVERLAAGALHRLLETRLGIRLARPALLRLHDVCGGNPLLALELARAQAEVEGPADGRVALPADVEALLRRRLAVVSPSSREALRIAAAMAAPTVFGRPTSHG
jgi:hypothetical protein